MLAFQRKHNHAEEPDKRSQHRKRLEERYGTGHHAALHNVPDDVLISDMRTVIAPEEFSDKEVIEFGAGCSLYLKLFLEFGCRRLVANDLSGKALRLNRINDPRYQPLPGDFLTVLLKDNSHDIVFAHLTMMLVVPLFDEFLARAHRVLRPGGSFVTFDANYICPVSIYRRYANPRLGGLAHIFSPFDLQRRAIRQGFEVPTLIPLTTNKRWTRGNWLLGTSFWMRAVKK
jgi:SAM-dependent methyltransferase